ncbi:endonuclease/exonuclease/phosphatase family protein [Vibrio sp. SM6]|uniref:Endonuclease/exonuclease/phosphatase family protein n=1 Tax=Vibrio agarilyticus TaxID=2726741 RepID=A0A7X8TQV6_9VIBR|nr:endonuclease/exonuclease/phosphatase family protein [Vibrio agarilyticus]NLS13173.1 endonuclease/exonuclease/phosphatase family protein [Vibrio agarilyticus]
MKKKLIVILFGIVALALGSFSTIFSVSDTPELTTISPQLTPTQTQQELRCFDSSGVQPIDNQGVLSVLVWNIYKQNRANWQKELEELSAQAQLLLLQEARLDATLKQWIESNGWNGNQVNAFKAFDEASGVLNLAKVLPTRACGYVEKEPWLQLPKSGIYATYPLSNGQTLATVNLHAVNFTLGVAEYQNQLDTLAQAVAAHQGPLIIAGDFNSWSETRMATMRAALQSLGVQEVMFSPDLRTEFVTGLPLDHLFYRGLILQSAQVTETDASDHNPLSARFLLPSLSEQ